MLSGSESSPQYNEATVKQILGIETFRQLSKEKAVEFVNMIPQMEPKVAIKALEQFPELANLMLGLAKESKEAYAAFLAVNEKSSDAAFSRMDAIIDVFKAQLDRDNLTPEERNHINDCLLGLNRSSVEVHKTNQEFIWNGLKLVAGTFSMLLFAGACVFVGSGRVNIPDFLKTRLNSQCSKELSRRTFALLPP